MAGYLAAEVPAAFERMVSATAAEFLRCLQIALPAKSVDRIHAGGCRVCADGLELLLDWTPAGERRIGLLVLPQLWVRYRFVKGDADTRARFLARLDRAMQRGGG